MIQMNKNTAIGVDIGGSHITSAAVDLLSGKVLKETISERAVDNKAPAPSIIKEWTDCLKSTLSRVAAGEISGIGFAMPSPFDYVKGISYIRGVEKYENLYGVNVREAVLESLNTSDLDIRFINDASAFAVGEAWVGEAAGYSRSVCVTFGTGFGSAFVSGKVPVVYGDEVPKYGCIFHIPYRDGIADDYFSTRWFLLRYKELRGEALSGVKELVERAGHDKVAEGLFHEFGDNAADFLAPWLKRFRAEILVIGGNISYAWHLFGEVFSDRLKIEGYNGKVSLSRLKEESAIAGSAYLYKEEFWQAVQTVLPLM
jgi:glucokinase